jgi:hypothetical protein
LSRLRLNRLLESRQSPCDDRRCCRRAGGSNIPGARQVGFRAVETCLGSNRGCGRTLPTKQPAENFELRHAGNLRSGKPANIAPLWHYGGTLENEAGQLIERVDDLETNESERCDHQIIAKMHERLETKCCSRTARNPEPNSDALKRTNTRQTLRQLKQKASAAAEVTPLSRTSS